MGFEIRSNRRLLILHLRRSGFLLTYLQVFPLRADFHLDALNYFHLDLRLCEKNQAFSSFLGNLG